MPEGKHILFLADINSVHTRRWVSNLILKGYRISIFSLSAKTTDWIDEFPEITFCCAGFTDNVIRSKSKFSKSSYFSAVKGARAFCKEMSPDIVHAHYASSYGMLAMRLKFKNSVLSLWGSDVYEFPRRSWLHRQLFRKIVNSVSVVCSTSQDMALEAKKYVNKDIHVTPFGIDVERFVPEATSNDVYTIGTVKTLEHVYGIDRLIVLFAAFKDKVGIPIRMKIFGKGSELGNLKMLVDNLGIKEDVEFMGYVEGDDLIKAFNSLDVFVALSRRESFGVAVLEAQACGKPVVVNNVGGLPEVMSDESGFLVEEDNLEQGILALTKLQDETLRKKMGERARQFVIDNYSEEACVNKLMDVYDAL